MKQAIAIMMLMSACGGQAADEQSTADAGTETTNVESYDPTAPEDKALTVPGAYGSEGGSHTACLVPWDSGECWIPLTKTINLASLCTGCNTDQTNGWVTAIYAFEGYLEAKGWVVNFVSAPEANVYMVTGDLSGNTLGECRNTASTLNDKPSQYGVYKRHHFSQVVIDFPRLAQQIASGYYGTCDTTCRRNAYRNMVLHELGHAAGFGHHTIAPNVMVNDWPYSQAPLAFTTWENAYLGTFVPN